MKWPILTSTKTSIGPVGGDMFDIDAFNIWEPGAIVPHAVLSPQGYPERRAHRHSNQSAYQTMWSFAMLINQIAPVLGDDAFFAVCAEYYRQSSLAFGNIRRDRNYLERKIRKHHIGLTVEDVDNQMIYERDPLSSVFQVIPMFSHGYAWVFFYSFRQKAEYKVTLGWEPP